jgi:hypothetical protein
MEHSSHIKILYGLVLALLTGMIVMADAWHQSQKAALPLMQGQNIAANAPAPTPALSGIVVGGGGPAVIDVVGTITGLSGGSVKVNVFNQNTTDAVVIGAATQFEIVGQFKDPATIQKELAAYNAQVDDLLKDPVKNKAALAAMRVPSPQTVTPATLADFKVGDQILVAATSTDASGAYIATVISKTVTQ